MAEQQSTNVSALDRVNTRRVLNHIKQTMAQVFAPAEEGGPLPKLTPDVRKEFTQLATDYLASIAKAGAVKTFEVKGMRRQTFKDIYRQRIDRETAVRVFWRRRKTKEQVCWQEGEHLTREQDAEFGHLLEMELWGMNGDLTGQVVLRRPSGYLMDMIITPVMPVQFVHVNLEIKDGQVQFT